MQSIQWGEEWKTYGKKIAWSSSENVG